MEYEISKIVDSVEAGAIVFCHKNQNKKYKARRLLVPQGVFKSFKIYIL